MSGSRFRAGLVVAAAMLAAHPIYAQGRRPAAPRSHSSRSDFPPEKEGGAPLEEFTKMSPEEREQELAKLPADKREKIQQQLDRYDRLSPEQKKQIDYFNHLPPATQNAFRKAYQRYQGLAQDRQQAMHEELNRLRAMTPGERKARMKSPEFQKQFNKGERQLVGDLAAVFPE